MPRTARYTLALLTATLLLAGCESMKDLGQEIGVTEGESATVSVPFPQIGDPVDVIVTASTNDLSKQGVRLLRIKEYAQAKSTFDSAIAASPTDHRSWFGLGVAREILGDNAAAKEAYVKALTLAPDEREYTQALNRIKMKLGEE